MEGAEPLEVARTAVVDAPLPGTSAHPGKPRRATAKIGANRHARAKAVPSRLDRIESSLFEAFMGLRGVGPTLPSPIDKAICKLELSFCMTREDIKTLRQETRNWNSTDEMAKHLGRTVPPSEAEAQREGISLKPKNR